MDTLELLRTQNLRTVYLLSSGESASSVPAGIQGALKFILSRVPAGQIQTNLLYAVLGKDGYVQYANWRNARAQEELETAGARHRKEGEVPFDDSLDDDSHWRAHSLALDEAANDAILAAGLREPPYEEVKDILGPYRIALVNELVHWSRQPPQWTEDEGDTPKSLNGNSEPP